MARKSFDPTMARGGGLFDAKPAGGAATPSAAPEGAGTAPAPSAATAQSTTPAAASPLTVKQVCERVRTSLDAMGRVSVVGEVSNFSPRSHWYFSVKDADAVLNCVMWNSAVARAAFQPINGMEVVVSGRLTYYGPSARTQLVVDKIERLGQGTLQQRFEELCRVLRAEGYFEDSRKAKLPPHPRCVAVVTSKHGAALQDVLRTAALRAPWVKLIVVEVPVQGEAAAPEVARAIRAIDRRADKLGIDAIVVTRGGGSLEDLWAFNERVVADAARACKTPIVAAIGHESDTTVIELVADRRASTPTQAMMVLLPDRAQLKEQLSHLTDRLRFLVGRRAHDARRTVETAARHPIFRSPRSMLAPHRARVDALGLRLSNAPRARLERAARQLADVRTAFERQRPAARQAVAAQRIESLHARLHAAMAARMANAAHSVDSLGRQLRGLGPEQVLSRGYSLTVTEQGAVLRDAADARVGSQLVTRLANGTVRSTVDSTSPTETRQ